MIQNRQVIQNKAQANECSIYYEDKETGLTGYIALCHPEKGPAIGGCRWMPYEDHAANEAEAHALARAMYYKAAFHGLPHGGGKAVLRLTEHNQDRTHMLKRFARFVHTLEGQYVTAIDMGTSNQDMETMRVETPYVICEDRHQVDTTDPSYYTALGVFHAILASCNHRNGAHCVQGKHVAIQGVGKTGAFLADFLLAAGARLTITDIQAEKLTPWQQHNHVVCVAPEAIMSVPCDILVPCAIGNVLNAKMLPTLKTAMIVPAANNPLNEDRVADALQAQGITYIPDFVSNGGGLILASGLYRKQPLEQIRLAVQAIEKRTEELLMNASKQQHTPLAEALWQIEQPS